MPLSKEFLDSVPSTPQGKIIIMNGPPSSGKGEAQNYLVNKYKHIYPFSFKGRLIDIACCIYGIPRNVWDAWYTRQGKEQKRPQLENKSQREVLIEVSESVIKPFYGNEFFGQCAAKDVKRAFTEGAVAAISDDGGFNSEITPLFDVVYPDNIYIFQTVRDGYNFNKDSRGYISHIQIPLKNYITLWNEEGKLDEFLEDVDYHFNTIIS